MANTTKLTVPSPKKAGPEEQKPAGKVNTATAIDKLAKAVEDSNKATQEQNKAILELLKDKEKKTATKTRTTKAESELAAIKTEQAKIALEMQKIHAAKQKMDMEDYLKRTPLRRKALDDQIYKHSVGGKVGDFTEKVVNGATSTMGNFGGSTIAGAMLGINPAAISMINQMIPIGSMAKWGLKTAAKGLGKGVGLLANSLFSDKSGRDVADMADFGQNRGYDDKGRKVKQRNPDGTLKKEPGKLKVGNEPLKNNAKNVDDANTKKKKGLFGLFPGKKAKDSDGNGTIDPHERSTSAVAGGEKRQILKKLDTIINTLKGKKDKKVKTEEKKEEDGIFSKLLGLGAMLLLAMKTGIKGIGKALGLGALLFGKKILGLLWNGLSFLPKLLWNGLKGVGSLIAKGFAPLKGIISNALNGAVSGLKNLAKGLGEGIKSGAGKAWNATKNVAGKAWNGAKNVASKAGSLVKSGASKVWNAIKGVGKAVTNSKAGQLVSKGASKVANVTKSVGSKAAGALGKAGKLAGKVAAPITSLIQTGFVAKDMMKDGVANTYENYKKNWSGWDFLNPSKMATVAGGWIGEKIGDLLGPHVPTAEEMDMQVARNVAKQRVAAGGTLSEDEYTMLYSDMTKAKREGRTEDAENLRLRIFGIQQDNKATLSTESMPTTAEMGQQQQVAASQQQVQQSQVIQKVIVEQSKQPPIVNNNYSTTVQQERTCYPVGDVARTVLFGATIY